MRCAPTRPAPPQNPDPRPCRNPRTPQPVSPHPRANTTSPQAPAPLAPHNHPSAAGTSFRFCRPTAWLTGAVAASASPSRRCKAKARKDDDKAFAAIDDQLDI